MQPVLFSRVGLALTLGLAFGPMSAAPPDVALGAERMAGTGAAAAAGPARRGANGGDIAISFAERESREDGLPGRLYLSDIVAAGQGVSLLGNDGSRCTALTGATIEILDAYGKRRTVTALERPDGCSTDAYYFIAVVGSAAFKPEMVQLDLEREIGIRRKADADARQSPAMKSVLSGCDADLEESVSKELPQMARIPGPLNARILAYQSPYINTNEDEPANPNGPYLLALGDRLYPLSAPCTSSFLPFRIGQEVYLFLSTGCCETDIGVDGVVWIGREGPRAVLHSVWGD